MDFPPSAFWDYSNALYARPGVPAACLRLQDRHCADVNLLLFALWAARHGIALDPSALRAADAAVADWRAAVIQPLRRQRRDLKSEAHGAPPDLAEIVRARIKAAELDAEHVAQLMLARFLPDGAAPAAPARYGDLARRNVDAYLDLLAAGLDGDDRAALDVILSAATTL